MISAQHHWSDLSVANHFVELQGNIHASKGILIQNTTLSAHYQPVLHGVSHPDVVISVLIASIRINTTHSRQISLS